MKYIEGGVCAPQGFTAHGLLCGIKPGRTRPDLALIETKTLANAAGVFTTNTVKAEPVKLTQKHIAGGLAHAIIVNAGNANACTGKKGYENACKMVESCARELGVSSEHVLVCSTGVIGQQLNIKVIENGIIQLCANRSKKGNIFAREAILTTDTKYKETAIETNIGNKIVRFGTMAKGSGMIHINMATMLGFITTDCAISQEMLDVALKESASRTYNCVSVDGDTSTNDTLLILANGLAGNPIIKDKNADYFAFVKALDTINSEMAEKIAKDGEGATHLLECIVSGACDTNSAQNLAKTIISSNLVKTAFFGKDANWGRILCAMGYSGSYFSQDKTKLFFESKAGNIEVFHNGLPLEFDEAKAKEILSEEKIIIRVELDDGTAKATAWGCDLTYDYVKINGDYRT